MRGFGLVKVKPNLNLFSLKLLEILGTKSILDKVSRDIMVF